MNPTVPPPRGRRGAAAPERAPAAPPHPRPRRHRYERLALALIAPAAVFMLLVHVLPSLAGLYTSFLNLNTFTIDELFGAPWTGLENFRTLLFDSDSPLRSGFGDALRNTAVYTAVTVAVTIG